MDNNISLISELYDIKRQNTDWEIKLENSSDFNTNIHLFADQINGKEVEEEVSKKKFDINMVPNQNLINKKLNNNRTVGQSIVNTTDMSSDSLTVRQQLNGNELIVDKCHQKKALTSPTGQKSSKNVGQQYDGIKNVEQYVERRKINGITWYYCLWNNCNYGSNKSNHLVNKLSHL